MALRAGAGSPASRPGAGGPPRGAEEEGGGDGLAPGWSAPRCSGHGRSRPLDGRRSGWCDWRATGGGAVAPSISVGCFGEGCQWRGGPVEEVFGDIWQDRATPRGTRADDVESRGGGAAYSRSVGSAGWLAPGGSVGGGGRSWRPAVASRDRRRASWECGHLTRLRHSRESGNPSALRTRVSRLHQAVVEPPWFVCGRDTSVPRMRRSRRRCRKSLRRIDADQVRRRRSASRYFSVVLRMTSGGREGAGGRLSQPRVSR